MNQILKQLIQECISEALDGNVGSDGNVDQHRNSVDNMQRGFAYMLGELDVLKDYRFYIISSNMLAMPWIFTGFAVFQSFVQTSKGWGPYVIAQSFMSYSILSVLTLFLSGFLIDKFTSRKLLIYMNIPLLFSVGPLLTLREK